MSVTSTSLVRFITYAAFSTATVASSSTLGNPRNHEIVVKDSRGNVRTFFGHVCGPHYLRTFFARHPISITSTLA
jgi:hypothetical protein